MKSFPHKTKEFLFCSVGREADEGEQMRPVFSEQKTNGQFEVGCF